MSADARSVHPPGVPRAVRPAGAGAGEVARLALPVPGREPVDLPDALGGDARRLELERMAIPAEDRDHQPTPWPQIHGKFLGLCRSVFEAVRARPDLRPDLVVAHGGRGAPTVFLPDCSIARSSITANITSRRITERHQLPDRPAAGRGRGPVLPALHQCAGAGRVEQRRRRLLGDALAEADVPRAVPAEDRGPLRRHRHGVLSPPVPPSPDRRAVDSRGDEGRHVRRPGLESMRGSTSS